MKKKKVSFATREWLVSIRELEVQRGTPGGSSGEAQAGAAGALAGAPGGPSCTRRGGLAFNPEPGSVKSDTYRPHAILCQELGVAWPTRIRDAEFMASFP